MKKSDPNPEREIARWFSLLRKQDQKLTQEQLAEKCGVPLGTLRHFEQTGQIGLPAFLSIARELDALGLFLSLARSEEPETFHKLAKEKAMSRLRDRLALATGEINAVELRKKNTRIPEALGSGPTRWRLAGRKEWIPSRNHATQL